MANEIKDLLESADAAKTEYMADYLLKKAQVLALVGISNVLDSIDNQLNEIRRSLDSTITVDVKNR